jgi:DNA-directed RNA polymerase subunit RPC12/RpoP
MAIDTPCSGCGKTLRVADDCIGKKARCPHCRTVYLVGSTPTLENRATQYRAPDDPVASPENPIPENPIPETTYANPLRFAEADSLATPLRPNELQSSLQPSEPMPTPSTEIVTRLFMVRVPSGDEFGPADAVTIQDWIQQNRLDDRCHIRQQDQESWIGIPAWQLLQKREAASKNVFSNSPNSLSAPAASNRSSVAPTSGRGVVVLILGILSWVLCFSLIGGILCAIFAIPLGFSELKRINQGESPSSEKWMVLTGLGLSAANVAATVVGLMTFIIVAIVNS